MKSYKIKFQYLGLALIISLGIQSCKINPIDDPNNPSASHISNNATLSEIQNVVDGSEGGMREELNQYYDDVSVIGREWYRFSGSDPRFTSDLLGGGTAVLDNNTFYITLPFAARYRVIKNLNILSTALTNCTAITDPNQKKVGIAYANTLIAYELLMNLNLEWENGIRADVKDPDAPGPFLSKDASFTAIIDLLNQSYADLSTPNVIFPFKTSLNQFVDSAQLKPIEFARFNRAIAARVNLYRADWTNALTALNQSFFDLNGSFNKGVYHYYSAAGGDLFNPVFFPLLATGETRVAQPSFVTDAEPGDTRLNKVALRPPATSDDLTSNYDVAVYKSNTDPVAIIRNEELILINAECNAQLGNSADAVAAINIIRSAAGLPAYSGGTSTPELITEILKQRRYSLYGEGHRWIDMRRYNLLNTLPIDRTGDNVWTEFPRPVTEN